jgi:hypothetical protein
MEYNDRRSQSDRARTGEQMDINMADFFKLIALSLANNNRRNGSET